MLCSFVSSHVHNGEVHMDTTQAAQLSSTDAQLYSINEACKILNISRRTLYSWIDKGKLEAEKVGYNRLVRISDTDVIKADFANKSAQAESDNTCTQAESSQVTHVGASQVTHAEASKTIQIDAEAYELLKSDLQHFKQKTIALEEKLVESDQKLEQFSAKKDEASKRHDIIVMQLSSTLNEKTFQLEETKKLNFIQRIFNFF